MERKCETWITLHLLCFWLTIRKDAPQDSNSEPVSILLTRGAIGCGLSADIRIQICLQPGYIYDFFYIRQYLYLYSYSYLKVSVDTNMVKTIPDPYPIRYPKVGRLIMISVWKILFFNEMRKYILIFVLVKK